MSPFLTRCLDHIRKSLDEAPVSAKYSDDYLLNQIEAAQEIVYEGLLRTLTDDNAAFITYYDLTMEEDKYEYPLPGNFRQLLRIVTKSASDTYQLLTSLPRSEILPTSFLDDRIAGVMVSTWGNYLVFDENAVSAGTTYRVWYRRGPSQYLHYGNPAAATESTLTLTDSPLKGSVAAVDNYYTGGLVRIVSGTGAGQTRRVTGHSGSVLTVSPDWDTTPDTESVYEIVPIVDVPHLDVAIIGNTVIGQMTALETDPAIAQLARMNLTEAMSAYANRLSGGQARLGPTRGTEGTAYPTTLY